VEQFKQLIESDSSSKPIKEVELENNKLREFLKDLNEKLTKLVKDSKPSNPKKIVEFKYKSEEEQLKTINQEIENNKKIIELKAAEYKKLKERLEVIKDPEYLYQIEEKIEETMKKAEEIKRGNQKLITATLASGKNLNNIENVDGMPQNIKEANEKTKDLYLLKRKLEKLQERNREFAKEKQEKSSKIQELTQEYNDLLSSNCLTPEDKSGSALQHKYRSLQNQYKNLQETLKLIEKKNEKHVVANIKREIDSIELAILRDKELISKLDEMIEKQSIELKDIIDKEGLHSDKAMHDVFTKIKSSLSVPKQKETIEEPKSKIISRNLSRASLKKRTDRSGELTPVSVLKDNLKNKTIDHRNTKSIDKPLKQPSEELVLPDKKQEISEQIEKEKPISPLKITDNLISPIKQTSKPDLFIRDSSRDFEEIDSSKPFQERSSENPVKEEKLNMPKKMDEPKFKTVEPDLTQSQEDLKLPENKKNKIEDILNDDEPKNDQKTELVLNEEFKPKKKKIPIEETDLEKEFDIKPKEKEIKDPFAKFDNIDPEELAKEKSRLPGSETSNTNTQGTQEKKTKSTRPRPTLEPITNQDNFLGSSSQEKNTLENTIEREGEKLENNSSVKLTTEDSPTKFSLASKDKLEGITKPRRQLNPIDQQKVNLDINYL